MGVKILIKLFIVLFIAISAKAEEITFQNVLDRVNKRDERTGAILSINTTGLEKEVEGFPKWHQFEIVLIGDEVKVHVYNSYMTGRKYRDYYFPLNELTQEELTKYQNYIKLTELDKAVEDAERKRRIFNQLQLYVTRWCNYEIVGYIFWFASKGRILASSRLEKRIYLINI